MEQDNNKMITQELQSAVKTIKAAILQSQVPELPGLKGFSEENIKLMRRFYETWKDIETISVVGTTDLQKADSEADSIRQLRLICTPEPTLLCYKTKLLIYRLNKRNIL